MSVFFLKTFIVYLCQNSSRLAIPLHPRVSLCRFTLNRKALYFYLMSVSSPSPFLFSSKLLKRHCVNRSLHRRTHSPKPCVVSSAQYIFRLEDVFDDDHVKDPWDGLVSPFKLLMVKLQHLAMPFPTCPFTRPLALRAAVRTRMLQRFDVPTFCCVLTRRFIQRVVAFVRPLQRF